MMVVILRVADFKDGDIVISEVTDHRGEVKWGDTNLDKGQGWVVNKPKVSPNNAYDIVNNVTKKKYNHLFSATAKFKVLRAVNDEPTEWGEMAL